MARIVIPFGAYSSAAMVVSLFFFVDVMVKRIWQIVVQFLDVLDEKKSYLKLVFTIKLGV